MPVRKPSLSSSLSPRARTCSAPKYGSRRSAGASSRWSGLAATAPDAAKVYQDMEPLPADDMAENPLVATRLDHVNIYILEVVPI